MQLYEKVLDIQQNLKVPKGQWNDFSKFYYRNMDDILQALKPLLQEHKLLLFMTDGIKEISGRFYIEATATLIDLESGDKITVNGYAREAEKKTGMDEAQITGTCSSYARKYALGGLFCLDDGNDPDAMDNRGANNKQSSGKQNNPPQGNNKPQNRQQNKPQNKPQNKQNNNGNGKLSDKEIEVVKVKMFAAGQNMGEVKTWVYKRFGKTDLVTLSKEEYNELCAALDSASTRVVPNL